MLKGIYVFILSTIFNSVWKKLESKKKMLLIGVFCQIKIKSFYKLNNFYRDSV